MDTKEEKESAVIAQFNKLPRWFVVLTMILTFLVIAAIIYLQFIRYYLVGVSINKSDLATSALLLSPEIATGISTIIRNV